ncbi:MAG: hypothetical protein M1834_008998 [Cirrosporium novae-zelandiae]|nr:MAG: hypothetical protein M1834_008998 [Cirrosporium novae-zelandiae]
MSRNVPNDNFTKEVHRLRAEYMELRETTHLVPPAGRSVIEQSVDMIENVMYHTYWYDDGRPQGQCIQLADLPGTLSGDILRLRQDLPLLNGDYKIVGNYISQLENVPKLPEPYEDDSENLSTILSSLPSMNVDPDKHFVKKGKYESEIRNLLKCQGGSCPGEPISPHIIQLLGKSSDGKLVFEKFKPRYIVALFHSLDTYKSWILQLIAGLKCLHLLGIVHRDLRLDNLLFSPDGRRLLICDLEGQWGNRLAPEISHQPVLNAGWTEKSDIYDLGHVIKGIVYGNAPITNLVEWPVPPPLDAIVKACIRDSPQERPSLEELEMMVGGIKVADS